MLSHYFSTFVHTTFTLSVFFLIFSLCCFVPAQRNSCNNSKLHYSLINELTNSSFRYEALTLYGDVFQRTYGTTFSSQSLILTLQQKMIRDHFLFKFGLLGFRSPLLTKSLLFSFPSLIKMLQFREFLKKEEVGR